MKSRFVLLAAVSALLLVSLGSAVLLGFDVARLRRAVARDRQFDLRVKQLEAENRRTRELLEQARADGSSLPAQLIKARTELAALESPPAGTKLGKPAPAELRTIAQADEQALAANRDPLTGLTRFEYFENAGQLTPSGTLQTVIWAVMKGDAAVLEKTLLINDTARAKAEVFIASMSEPARNKAETPEKLAALIFQGTLLNEAGWQIGDETMLTPDRATVSVRTFGGAEMKVPLRRDSTGWRWEMNEVLIEKFRRNWERQAAAEAANARAK